MSEYRFKVSIQNVGEDSRIHRTDLEIDVIEDLIGWLREWSWVWEEKRDRVLLLPTFSVTPERKQEQTHD